MNAQMRTTFSEIYQSNAWGSPESVSGPGSTAARAADFVDDLVAFVRGLGPRLLLDAPCGDFNWAAAVADAAEHYVGIDVVPAIIDSHQRRHASPRRAFLCLDITEDALPSADLVLCRDALVHFSYADIAATIRNLKRSGSRHLLTTTFIDYESNVDIATGGWRKLNLERPPFSFPPPTALVDEKCPRVGGEGKRLALWPIDALP
jgi:SAM-dependent methyltransferase